MKLLIALLPCALLISRSCHAQAPTTAELIEQIEGKHCRYKGDSETFPERCVTRGPLEFLTERAPGGKDCRCRGAAASCLANQSDAKSGLPALIAYIERGPADYDTGDGIISCLSAVMSALKKIGDPSAIDPLISYLNNPRTVTPSAGSIKPPPLSSILEAAETLGSFGVRAQKAAPALEAHLNNSSAKDLSREFILAALGKIGASGENERLVRELENFKEALRTSLVRRSNVIIDFGAERSASALLLALKNVDEEEREKQGSANEEIVRRIFAMTQNELPQWMESNIEKPMKDEGVHFRGSGEQFNKLFDDIRRVSIRILARRKDPAVISNLPEILLLGLNQKENVAIILGYGDKLLTLIPTFEALANDLQFQNKPLSETVDGAKYSRACAIIDILKGLDNPRAKKALDVLHQSNSLLAERIDGRKKKSM